MNESINQFIAFATSAHPYIQALLILGGVLIVALVVLPFVSGIIKYLTRKTETDVDDELIKALNKPIVYIVFLIGVLFVLPLLDFSTSVFSVVKSFVYTLFVIVIAQAILESVRVLLDGATQTRRVKAVNAQTVPLFNNISFIVILAAAIYALFLIWGIDVTAWLASAGILGIAIGFAAKDTLSNIISGVFILTDKPYSVGDFVLLGSGITGIVSAVGLRSTRIRTFDDEEVTIPNATIANEAITNKSTGPDTGRVKIDIGVAYGSDLDAVEEMLLDIARANEMVLDTPEPSVSFIGFGDSSLNLILSCRVKDPLDVFGTKSTLRYAINNRFAESNIEIPFPQRDVNLKQ